MADIQGKVVVVTGASSGVGAVTAKELANRALQSFWERVARNGWMRW